jgi:hypothetical protein
MSFTDYMYLVIQLKSTRTDTPDKLTATPQLLESGQIWYKPLRHGALAAILKAVKRA